MRAKSGKEFQHMSARRRRRRRQARQRRWDARRRQLLHPPLMCKEVSPQPRQQREFVCH